MSFYIRNSNGKFIRSDIDSSGMSVTWVPFEHADRFVTRSNAEAFVQRLIERYPNEQLEVREVVQ